MTSPLPPRRRDTRNLADLLRQDRQNLRQLGTGFAGGRNPLARPLRSTAQVDVEDDDADVESLEFRNVDTLTATGPGQVTFPLTYEPVDGSLQVWWGGIPQPPSEWTLNGNVVTIPDPLSRVRSGAKFTAYYAYVYEEPDVVTLDTITFRGMQRTDGALSAPLHASTQIGDTILLVLVNEYGTAEITCTDARMTQIDSVLMAGGGGRTSQSARVYMGKATTLAALQLSGAAWNETAFVLSFAEAMTATVHSGTVNDASTPKSIPSVSSPAALCVAVVANDTVTGGSPTITGTGWTTVSDSGPNGNFSEFAVATFLDNSATTTPSGSVSATSGDRDKGFWVLTIGVGAVQT